MKKMKEKRINREISQSIKSGSYPIYQKPTS